MKEGNLRILPGPAAAAPAPARSHSPVLRRKCACGGAPGPGGECAECREKRLSMERLAGHSSPPETAPPIVHQVLGSPGRGLDRATRAEMEARFGHDFGQVRVHTGPQAAASAEAVGARAYTVGRDVVFGGGRYDPRSAPGSRLLAHELVHVLQQGQRGGSLQTAPLEIGGEDEFEREADSLAGSVMEEDKEAME